MKVKIIRGWTNKNGIEALEKELNAFLRSLDVKDKPQIIPHYCEDNLVLLFVHY